MHVGVDSLFVDYPLRSFRGDLFVTRAAGQLFGPLGEALAAIADEGRRVTRTRRIAALPTPATSVVANAWHHCLTSRV